MTVYPTADVREFGAKGDNSHDDTGPLQEAYQSGCGALLWPEGTYLVTAPIVVEGPVRSIAAGRGSVIIRNLSSDVFHIAGPRVTFEHMEIRATKGHIFRQVGTVQDALFLDLELLQLSPTHSVYAHLEDLGNYIGNLWLHFGATHTVDATVPLFHFRPLTAEGATNSNRWQDYTITNTGHYGFMFESARDGNYIYDMVLRDGTWEIPVGGCVRGLGLNSSVIDGQKVYDLHRGPAVRDLFSLGAGTDPSSPRSRGNRISNMAYIGSNNDLAPGVRHIRLEGGAVSHTYVENCNQHLQSPLLVDYGDTSVVELACWNMDRDGATSTTILSA